MNCERVRTLLPGYVDGELDLVTGLEIEEHLKTCADCSREVAHLLELQSLLVNRRAELVHPAPPDLRRRIRTSIHKASGGERAALFGAWRLAAAALVLGLVVLAAVGLASGWFNPRADLLAQEVEIAHVRSLMADHLTDVTSTDQHTVKPWFDGKLDFSPPVVDLAAQGFPLDGGRLDYIDGHPAAALVYLRNKHVINLLIWPSTDPPAGVRSSTTHGYHLFQWNQSGMAFWAVSDLESGELQNFVQLIQKNLP